MSNLSDCHRDPEQDHYRSDVSEDKKQKPDIFPGFGGVLLNCFIRLQNKQRLSMLSLGFVLFLCFRKLEGETIILSLFILLIEKYLKVKYNCR